MEADEKNLNLHKSPFSDSVKIIGLSDYHLTARFSTPFLFFYYYYFLQGNGIVAVNYIKIENF